MTAILIVEDDRTIAMGIQYALEQEGFRADTRHDAASALQALAGDGYDLVVLDVALPDGNGFDLCRRIREKRDTPVIFLTASDDEVHVVMGLDLGADDYMTKPFGVREFISRIRSVLRRYQKQPHRQAELAVGDLRIHASEAKVTKRGQDVHLTTLEYKLLLNLVRHAGQVLTRNQILEGIWDIDGDFVNDNTLSVYIKRLREKLEDDPQQPQMIVTVRGLGYRIGDGHAPVS